MGLIVQKYGGTSVKNISKIKKACLLISAEKNRGNNVVVVASAMAGYTNKMINTISKICEISPNQVNIKGKTTEKLGLIGKDKAIAAEAIVSVTNND